MKRLVIAVAIGGLLAGVVGATQRLVPAQSEIAFTTRQMGVPVEGRFRRFDAEIAFDVAKPQAGRIQITIDTGSAGFGSPELDVEVPKASWLDASRFPKAVFRSSSIRPTGPDRFEVAGKLTLKGVDRDITVPVKIAQSAGAMTASGAFVIKRLDFKVGDGEWRDTSMVADEVQVKFTLAVAGAPSL
jgi:polyisoprenoid-binding protein YceI